MRLKRADFRSGREGGRTDGQMDGQTDKREEEQKSPCVLKDFVPFRAAAQKKKTSHPRIAHGQRYPMPYLE